MPDQLFEDLEYRNSIIDNHPNAKGHKIIADNIYNTVKLLIRER